MASMIWINGSLIDSDAAKISPLDHGMLVGDGIFETCKIERGQPFALSRHLQRLLRKVDHAAQECQRHEVDDGGDQRPQAEAQQLALEEIDHVLVLCRARQAAAGAAWFVARKALTARSRLTGIDCTLRAPLARRNRSKPASWSSTR